MAHAPQSVRQVVAPPAAGAGFPYASQAVEVGVLPIAEHLGEVGGHVQGVGGHLAVFILLHPVPQAVIGIGVGHLTLG